ncbi:MAG: Crp/Fnr family transcriptional regulator [Bacteroidota bacterium]
MSVSQLLQVMKYMSPGIPDEELDNLLLMLSEGQVSRGEHLVTAGQNFRFINFITKGAARMYHLHKNGNETNIILGVENDFVQDYESLIKGKTSDFYVQATEDSSFIHIDYNKFEELLGSTKHWEHCGRMINQFVLLGVFASAQSFMFLTPQERYLKLLREQPRLIQRFSQEHIASYLGIKRESLSRIKNRVARRF